MQVASDDTNYFWRLRETKRLLDWLGGRTNGLMSATAAKDWLDAQPLGSWYEVLDEALEDFRLDVGDGDQPVESFREWLAEWGCELRRRQKGLLLLSAHRAKGLEFDHVVILDGNWQSTGHGEDPDAWRRLFYVSMTRARKTLALARFDTPNHTTLSGAGGVDRRRGGSVGARPDRGHNDGGTDSGIARAIRGGASKHDGVRHRSGGTESAPPNPWTCRHPLELSRPIRFSTPHPRSHPSTQPRRSTHRAKQHRSLATRRPHRTPHRSTCQTIPTSRPRPFGACTRHCELEARRQRAGLPGRIALRSVGGGRAGIRIRVNRNDHDTLRARLNAASSARLESGRDSPGAGVPTGLCAGCGRRI